MALKSSYKKWKSGLQLSRKEAMEANCYECNGKSAELTRDCLGESSCALYLWSPWGKEKSKKGLKRGIQGS
jgi:hypothetical protein